MKTRAKQGSTLSLIVACTLVIALLGIGFIILTMIFGGHREVQHATDSGSLNVAKRAILAPAVNPSALQSDIGLAMAGALTSPQGSGINMGNGVNLLNFNRMVAQAMLVGLNADAEGAASGIQNARAAFDFIEGSSQSIGAQLKTLLSDNSAGNWANQDYDEVEGNVLRMLGAQGAPAYQAADFQVGYLNQRSTDFKGTNIDMSSYDSSNSSYNQNLLPIKDYTNASYPRSNFPSSAFVKAPSGGSVSYMAGYTPIQIGSGSSGVNFYGVPTNPGSQPHLESVTTFAAQTDQPGGTNVYLPPNSFRIGAQASVTATTDGTNHQAHTVSVSMVGTPQTPFQMQIPNGYIVIDNSATQSFSGAAPNTDNVAADELGTGILVDKTTGYFSYGSGPPDSKGNPTANLIDQWQAYDHDPDNFAPSPNDPPYQGIYDKNGSALTNATQAAQIPYVPNPSQNNPPSILCTDNNSSAPGGDSACIQHASAPSGQLSPFDKAYHPNSLANGGGGISTNQATASELSQCKVIDLYGPTPRGGGPAESYNFSFGPTGIRKYPNGLPNDQNQYAWLGPNGNGFGMAPDAPYSGQMYRSSSSNSCQVTVDGTIQDYFEQTKPGSYGAARAFLVQRMLEIQPNGQESVNGANSNLVTSWSAGQQETDEILKTKISLGNMYYIYMKNGKLTIDTTGPGYIGGQSAGARLPDGNKHEVSITYSILQGVANPYYAYGIHDRLFTTWGNNAEGNDMTGDITATDTAYFQPASGAYGLLGVVKFTETSGVNASLAFNNRD